MKRGLMVCGIMWALALGQLGCATVGEGMVVAFDKFQKTVDSRIVRLEGQVAAADQKNKELELKVQKLESEGKKKDDQIAALSAEITEVRQQLAALEKNVNEDQTALAELEKELDGLSKMEVKTPEEEQYRSTKTSDCKLKKAALESKVSLGQQVVNSLKKTLSKLT